MMLDQLRDKVPGTWEFIEGDNVEFGEPEKLVLVDKKDIALVNTRQHGKQVKVRAEVQYKPGNSWYFSHCSNVGILSYIGRVLENSWFDWQVRYLDKGVSYNNCLEWLRDVIEVADYKTGKKIQKVTTLSQKYINENKLSELRYLQHNVFKVCKNAVEQTIAKSALLNSDRMKQLGIEVTIKKPMTFYAIPNDEFVCNRAGKRVPYVNYAIVEVNLPYPSIHERMSLIIQCRQDGVLFYTIRVLTSEEKPELIRIDREESIKREDLIGILSRWVQIAEEMFDNN